MAANCDVCGKGPGFGHSISHSPTDAPSVAGTLNIQRVRAGWASPQAPERVHQLPEGRQGARSEVFFAGVWCGAVVPAH